MDSLSKEYKGAEEVAQEILDEYLNLNECPKKEPKRLPTNTLFEPFKNQCSSICRINKDTGKMECFTECKKQYDILYSVSCIPNQNFDIKDCIFERKIRLNGKIYQTEDLIDYLLSNDSLCIPHSNQSLTVTQIENLVFIISLGYKNIIVSPKSDTVYAIDEAQKEIEESDILLLEDSRDLTYYQDAFHTYAKEISFPIGTKYKPYVNFGIARTINLADPEVFPMGKDLECVSSLLNLELQGIEPSINNLEKAKKELEKVTQDKDLMDQYALPWSLGMNYSLSKKELRDFRENENHMDLIENANQEGEGKTLLAAYLTEEEFKDRLASLQDRELLREISHSIPFEGPNIRQTTFIPYVLKEEDLYSGVPLMIPMNHSLGEKTKRMKEGKMIKEDMLDKGSPLVFEPRDLSF